MTEYYIRDGKQNAFRIIERANLERGAKWHNGSLANWSPLEWGGAMAGEAGELCNVLKKLKRYDDEITQSRLDEKQRNELIEQAAEEAADVFIYLDLVCQRIGVSLFESILHKFNATSEKVGFDTFLFVELKSFEG